MNTRLKQTVSGLALVAVVTTTFAGALLLPKRASGFALGILDPSVPVEGDGGYFDMIGVQPSYLGDTIISSLAQAGAIRAAEALSEAFATKLDESIKITDFSGYEQALLNSKNFASVMRQRYGEDVLQGTLGDVYQIAQAYENMGLNTSLTPEQAARLGLGRGRTAADRDREVRRLIVGATAMFTSSISCAGVNPRAVRNTASYLAAASAGVIASEIKANSGIKFYQDMGQLGSPLSTPAFWELAFRDMASQAESEARRAGALEITSPGIKSPQTRNPLTGIPEIRSSQTLIRSSQEQSIGTLFGTARNAGSIRIPTNSFKGFISYVGALYAQGLILKGFGLLGGLLGKIIGVNVGDVIAKISGKLTSNASWVIAAQSYGQFVAEQITRAFVKAMYDKVISMVFRGQILRESLGCRRPAQLTAFKSNINTAQISQNAVTGLMFNAIPDTIVRGEASTLSWNATGFGDEDKLTVTLSGFGRVEASGSREARPTATTTYTLTVAKQGGTTQTFTQTVTVLDQDLEGDLFFTATPATIQKGGASTLSWNASAADSGSIVTISGVGEVQPVGSVEVQPAATTTYTLTATVGGLQKTTRAAVTVRDQLANSPDFNKVKFDVQPQSLLRPGNVNVTWDASALSGVEVYILPVAEGNLPLSGRQSHAVNQTTVFTIIVTDAGGEMVGSKGFVVTVGSAAEPGGQPGGQPRQ